MPTPPVDPSESLYRQIGPGGNPIFYNPDQHPPVHRTAFLPSREDADGLSLIRASLRTEIWSAFRLEQPTVRFRLSILKANELAQLADTLGFDGIRFVSNSDGLDNKYGEPWAHCVVCEINRIDYDNDPAAKKRIKEWAWEVARQVTAQDVIGPWDEPTEADAYRP